MATVFSGLLLWAESSRDENGVKLRDGLVFIAAPEGSSSEAGLDSLDWAQSVPVPESARVVYVEVEFFGGEGSQAAVGLQSGEVALGPFRTRTPGEDRSGYENVADLRDHAVNRALRWLGVEARGGQDEFLAGGLEMLR